MSDCINKRGPVAALFRVAEVGMDDRRARQPGDRVPGESNEKHGSAEGSFSFPPGLGSVVLLEFINTAITCGLQMK